MLLPGMGPRWNRAVRSPGAAGHPEKAMPHTRTSSSPLLPSTYDSPRQELVPEGSPFLQAEQDTPCNTRYNIYTRGTCHSPLATDPRLTPGHVPTLPRPSHRQAHQAISDVLITAKPPTAILHLGGNIWEADEPFALGQGQHLHGMAGKLGRPLQEGGSNLLRKSMSRHCSVPESTNSK